MEPTHKETNKMTKPLSSRAVADYRATAKAAAITLRPHNCKITRVEDGFHALCPECGWQDLSENRREVRAAATMHSIFQPALDLKPCRDCSGRGFYSSSFGKLTCNVCRGSGKVERPSKYVAPRPTDVLRAE